MDFIDSKKVNDKIFSSIKYIILEMFNKCTSFDLDCIGIFKGKTGEIMKVFFKFPIYNKYYLNLNKIIIKIPEIFQKLYELDLDVAGEIISSLLSNASYFEFNLVEEDNEYQNDPQYFQLISTHLLALKELFSYLNEFQCLLIDIKELKNSIIKKSDANNPGSIVINNTSNNLNPIITNSNSSNVYNYEGIQFTEDKLKTVYDKLESLLYQGDNFIEYFRKHELLYETGFLNMFNFLYDIVNCIDSLFLSYKEILSLDSITTTNLMVKVMNYLDNNNSNLFSKTNLYCFLLTFYLDNQHKQTLLLKLYYNVKKQDLASLLDNNILNINTRLKEFNSKNNLSNNLYNNITNNNTAFNNNKTKNNRNNNYYNANTSSNISNVNSLRSSCISIPNDINEELLSSLKLKNELFTLERGKYVDYFRKKIQGVNFCWMHLYFNKRKYFNSLHYSFKNNVIKQHYLKYYSDKDIIMINSIVECCDKHHDDDNGALNSFASEIKNTGFYKIKHSNCIYMFNSLSNFIIVGIKLRDKYENKLSCFKNILNSIEEKFANVHIYDQLNLKHNNKS